MPKRKWESTGFGERLKSIREAAGRSQQQLADATGVDVMTVSRLERGEQEPAWPLVLAFCAALGVNTEAFRPGAEQPLREKLGRREGTSLPMVSCTGSLLDGAIQLKCDRISPADVGQFADLFDETWSYLSPEHQRLVKRYWRSQAAPEDCRSKPNVKDHYDTHIAVYRPTLGSETATPRVLLEGHVLNFPTNFLDDNHIAHDLAVIAFAHELAHVTFYASSEPNHWADTREAAAYDAAERLVDQRLLEWGVAPDNLRRLDAWLKERGLPRFLAEATSQQPTAQPQAEGENKPKKRSKRKEA